jgi:phosphatidylglycerol---prolipoprotein diacylglyceryl transferase
VKNIPAYELFFVIGSYVALLSFLHFSLRCPPRLFSRLSTSRLFVIVSLVSALAAAHLSARLLGLGSGLMFYGGLVGFLVATALFARFGGHSFVEILNRCTPGLALGHAVGRIGCFLEGCCYGSHCDLPWAVHNASAPSLVHPVQLYEASALALLGIALWRHETRRLQGLAERSSAGIYLVTYATVRFVLEFYRGDLTRGESMGLSTSQWISLGIFVVGVGLLRSKHLNKPKIA